jgi:ankyrin repeat protein
MAQEILNWEPVGPTLLAIADSSGRTPLHFAILHGHLDVVELFIHARTSIDQARISDSHGSFPVHAAAMAGSTRILDELVKKCPDYYELVDNQEEIFSIVQLSIIRIGWSSTSARMTPLLCC